MIAFSLYSLTEETPVEHDLSPGEVRQALIDRVKHSVAWESTLPHLLRPLLEEDFYKLEDEQLADTVWTFLYDKDAPEEKIRIDLLP